MDPQDFEGNPYDEELYTTMHEVYEGESGTKLIPHIDTFHLANKETEKVKDFCLKEQLARLFEEDRTFVDRAQSLLPTQDDEDEEIRSEPVRPEKRKKKNPYIIYEAGEDRMDSSYEEEPHEREVEPREETRRFGSEAKCKESSGRVPGYDPWPSDEEIDGKIYEMEDPEKFDDFLEMCSESQTFQKSKSEKFCVHENDEDYLTRISRIPEENESTSCLRQFAMYIIQPKFRNYVFLAHYGSGFDAHFIFLELIKMGLRVSPIFKGNKLLSFKIVALNISFIDFFCFVPTSLKNLEKSFDLKTGSKGYFPHLLNKPENYSLKISHLPPQEYYEVELMRTNDVESFKKWYSENYNKNFNFADEMTFYCELDVKILLAAALKFIRETLEQQKDFRGKVRNLLPCGVPFYYELTEGVKMKVEPDLCHPFSTDICTLSTFANVLFRGFYLPENYLPIVTQDLEESYSCRSSTEELEYLSYLQKSRNLKTLEFGRGPKDQRKIQITCPRTEKNRTFYVDGYDPENQVNINLKSQDKLKINYTLTVVLENETYKKLNFRLSMNTTGVHGTGVVYAIPLMIG